MASFKERGDSIQVSIRRKGYRPIYETFDNTPAGRKAAEQWAEDTELKIKHNRYVEADNSKDTPIRDVLRRYQREIVSTMKSKGPHNSRVNLLCSMPLTDRTMGQLTGMHIAQWRDELIEDDYSASSVRILMGIISRVYTIASTEWGIAVTNPVSKVRRPKEPPGRTRRLIGDEEHRLLDHLEQPYHVMVLLLLETAMRRSELCSLQWRKINLNDSYLLLTDTKNGEDRPVPLSSTAVKLLRSLPRHITGNVFNVHKDTITHAFGDACKLAGIEDLRLHDLRHEAASRLFEKGVFDIMEVASITGHKDVRMLKRYVHLNASKLAKKLG